jgi:hypothetical protein
MKLLIFIFFLSFYMNSFVEASQLDVLLNSRNLILQQQDSGVSSSGDTQVSREKKSKKFGF